MSISNLKVRIKGMEVHPPFKGMEVHLQIKGYSVTKSIVLN